MGMFDHIVSLAQQVIGSAASAPLGGRSLSQWERDWLSVGCLTDNFSTYARYVGVYRAELHGELVYIGRAIEWDNGGFRKRLSDYTRSSESSRTHGSGRRMHAHANELQISLIITGEGAEAAKIAAALEIALIGKYQPAWNAQHTGQ